MISLSPVKLDLALDQAMDFSKVVWNFRYANGTPIDLSNTTGSCFFMKTYPIWQGYNEDVYTLNASADSSGNLKLSSNAAYMSNVSACNYVYSVVLVDSTDYTSVKALHGILTINSAVNSTMPPLVTSNISNTIFGDKIAETTSTSMLAVSNSAIAEFTIVSVRDGNAYNPDLSKQDDVTGIVGLSQSSVVSGTNLVITKRGIVNNAAWTWNVGPIYCSETGGNLVQSIPQTGLILQVATALSATSIQLNINPAVAI